MGYNKWSKFHRSLAVEAHTKRNQGLREPGLTVFGKKIPITNIKSPCQYVAPINHLVKSPLFFDGPGSIHKYIQLSECLGPV